MVRVAGLVSDFSVSRFRNRATGINGTTLSIDEFFQGLFGLVSAAEKKVALPESWLEYFVNSG
jgi:hypothetical protein